MDVVLAQSGRFCAGAVRAVELALERYRVSVHELHEIAHNRHAVGGLCLPPERCRPSPAGAQAAAGAHRVPPGGDA